jgi:hypothetical protein
VAFKFRPDDKCISVKAHYPGDYHKFVQKGDFEQVLTIFNALANEKCIKLHTKERYKKGVQGVKEPSPDFEFYQGYGNMEKLGALPLLQPDRFVEVVMAHGRSRLQPNASPVAPCTVGHAAIRWSKRAMRSSRPCRDRRRRQSKP